jgi:F-type H+-transporting ATPase subunit b
MAMDRIAAAEAGAVAEVRNAATEVAVTAARDVLAASMDAEADAAMIDQAVADLPRALRAA